MVVLVELMLLLIIVAAEAVGPVVVELMELQHQDQ
jgi:hypothetical protein